MKCPSRNSFAMRGRKSKLHIIKIVIRKQIKNKVRNNCTSKNTHEKYVNIRTVLTFFQRQFFSTQNWKNTFSLPEQNLKKCVLFFRQFQPKSKLFSLSPSSFELHFEKKILHRFLEKLVHYNDQGRSNLCKTCFFLSSRGNPIKGVKSQKH